MFALNGYYESINIKRNYPALRVNFFNGEIQFEIYTFFKFLRNEKFRKKPSLSEISIFPPKFSASTCKLIARIIVARSILSIENVKAEVTDLRSFSRRSGGMMGWASVRLLQTRSCGSYW